MTGQTKKGRIVIDNTLCKGCYLCISVCPNDCITIAAEPNEKGYYPAKVVDIHDKNGGKCIGCALCAIICPDIAIEVYRG
mgnify:CR=1 FL=1